MREDEAASRRVPAVHGLLLAMVPALIVLTIVAPLPVIPAMVLAFSGQANSASLVSLALTAPILAIAISSSLMGFVGDRMSRQAVLVFGTAVYAITAPLPLVIDNILLLLASRFLAGLALGLMLTAAVGLTGDYFTGRRRAFWLSMQSSLPAGAAIVGSAISGVLGQYGWRMPFMMLGLGLVLLVLLPLIKPPRIAPDAEAEASEQAHTTSGFWLSLSGIFLLAVVASLTIFPAAYEFGYVLEEHGSGSALMTGAMTSVLGVGAMGGAFALSKLMPVPPLGRLALCLGAASLGYALMGLTAAPPLLLGGALLIGVGQGLSIPTLSLWLLDKAGASGRGRVVGPFQATLYVAQFAAPLCARQLAVESGAALDGVRLYGLTTFAIMGLLLLIAMLRFMGSRRRATV